ncbi:hypothetical protein F4679DRAFT_587152 [Xylaria curta]|nr:hypothetical protein F4679DRAFT_587152 [Xylaria curta]
MDQGVVAAGVVACAAHLKGVALLKKVWRKAWRGVIVFANALLTIKTLAANAVVYIQNARPTEGNNVDLDLTTGTPMDAELEGVRMILFEC